MNVAYILNSTILSGGATKSFIAMLRRLIPMGVSPLVIVPDRDGVYGVVRNMGVPILAMTFRMNCYSDCSTMKGKALFLPRMGVKILANKIAERRLVPVLRQRGIELVHSNVGFVDIGFNAARQLGLPHIYHLREYGIPDFGLRHFPSDASFYQRLNAPHSYNICITSDIQRHHRQFGKEECSRVIYNGIQPAVDEMPTDSRSGDFFLFAGRIQPAKSVDTLLEAYANYCSLTTQPLPLRLAGSLADSTYVKKLETFIAQHGMREHISFLGDCSNIGELMQSARAIIIPSQSEGFGRCMPEAMFQGCLAIGRNTAGTKEQFDNGLKITGEEIGLRYDTTHQLAQLLQEVSLRPVNFYNDYRERAFKVVNHLYSSEANAKQVYDFYREILCRTE